MLVSDIWNEAKSSKGYGNCNSTELYNAITQAVELLSDKGAWDWKVGWMTICAYDGYFTMPREVEKVLAVNINGHPAWARDMWYMHHVNGTGDYTLIDGYNAFYDEVGVFPTFRDVAEPSLLVGLPSVATDEGKELLVYGYDWNDKELYHTDPVTGNDVKGIRVPITLVDPPAYPDPLPVKKIDRVVKPVTDGCIQLWAYPQCFDAETEPYALGLYYPDETQPRYRRYRFPKYSCIGLKYQRKTLTYGSQDDFIPFDNHLPLMLALKAVREYANGNMDKGQVFENKAIELLESAEKAKKQKTDIGPQVKDFSSYNQERLRGYRRAGSNYRCWC